MDTDKTLYLYVYENIITSIYNETYAYKEQLPSITELCEQYQVGRNTMRSAMARLQKNGYVTLEKGTRARVNMDIHDTNINQRYLQTLINRKKMMSDVFITLEWIMPDIIGLCIQQATQEDKKMIYKKIKSLDDDDHIETNRQIMQHLMDIYLACISILKNPFLDDLFISMIQMMVMPFSNTNETNPQFKLHINKIKKILVTAISFALHGNVYMVRKIVHAFTSLYCRLVLKFIDTICKDMNVTRSYQMKWLFHTKQRFLYDQVVLDIMKDIEQGHFRNHEVLPSISDISLQYNVSTRTSRKAIKILNTLGVLNTMNGVGSKVVIQKHNPSELLLDDENLLQALKDSYHALKLLALVASCIFDHVMHIISKDARKILLEALQNPVASLRHTINEFLFVKCNDFLQEIYHELSQPLIWEVYVSISVSMLEYYPLQESRRKEFVQLMYNQKYRKAALLLREPLDAWEFITYEVMEKQNKH